MNILTKGKVLAKRAGHSINSNATTWLTVGSAIGFVATVVSASKQTTKLESIVTEHKTLVKEIHEAKEKGYVELTDNEDGHVSKIPYSEEDGKKDITIVYTKTGMKLLKLYAVPAIIGTLTLIAMFESDSISRRRKLEVSAAYAALDKAFRNYRDNIIERYGEDLDQKVLAGIRETEVTTTKVKKDGTEVTKTKKVETHDEAMMNPYYFFFQEGVDAWTKEPQENKRRVCARLNDCLKIFANKRYLTWNDIRAAFHLGGMPGGDKVGFVWDDSKSYNDNIDYVKYGFGFFDVHDEAMMNFGEFEGNVLIQNKNLDYNIEKTMRDRLYAKHQREKKISTFLTDNVEADIRDGKLSL